ncbi:MAG: hypothetical protein Q9195_006714 [Heterodermia aff. obscurata]
MAFNLPPGTDLSTIPAGIPPPGVIPNFVNPPSLAPTVLGINITFMTEFAAQEILYPTTFVAKLAILLLYRRVFTVKKPLLYGIYLGMLITLLLYIPNVFLAAYFCAPHVGQGWNAAGVGGCNDLAEWYVIQAALIVVLDLYIFILPLPTIMQLQMPARRRHGIMLVFMTAILAVLAAIAQLANRPALWKSKDETWHAGLAIIFTCLENYISIIVGSTPAFSCFMNAHFVDRRLLSGLYSRLARSPRRTNTDGSRSKDKNSSDSKLPIISGRSKYSKALAEEGGYINLDDVPDQQIGGKVRGNTTTPEQNRRGETDRFSDMERGHGSAEAHGELR